MLVRFSPVYLPSSPTFLAVSTAHRVRLSTRTQLAFSRRGFHAFLRDQHRAVACSSTVVNRVVQAVIALSSSRDGSRQDSGHSPFRGPARGTLTARADLDLHLLSCRSSTTSLQNDRPDVTRPCYAGFNLSFSTTLAPKPTWNSVPSIHMRCRMPDSLRATATIAQSMLPSVPMRPAPLPCRDWWATR